MLAHRIPHSLHRASDALVEAIDKVARTKGLHDALDACTIHKRTYRNWLLGYSAPKMDMFIEFANFLGYDLRLVKMEKADATHPDNSHQSRNSSAKTNRQE